MADLALDVAFRAALIALTLGFLEQFVIFERAFGSQGPFSPAIAGIFGRTSAHNRYLGNSLRSVVGAGAMAGIVGIAAGPFSAAGRVAALTLLLCLALTKVRRVTASDGAEQMAVLTIFAICVALIPGPNANTATIAVWFIAGQAMLSYTTAGIAKALSETWRSGEAVPLVMSSESHGHPALARLLANHPDLGKALTRSVVLFECCFPLILVAPPQLALLLLLAGVAFHLGCAITMGLNAFLFAFPGTYLCVAYVAQSVSPFW
jgi:hypothetical protein